MNESFSHVLALLLLLALLVTWPGTPPIARDTPTARPT
jgi:hypothetical protein